MAELLIGCGRSRAKVLSLNGVEWKELVTLDSDPSCKPDVVHDLEVMPYPFEDERFDECHAYDVLEHMGRQGDWQFFFGQWAEFHRILKPEGLFLGIVPYQTSPWAWGDPSHTRIVTIEQLGFLSQKFYEQVGNTAASDFRHCWRGHFELVFQQRMAEPSNGDIRQAFVLKKMAHG